MEDNIYCEKPEAHKQKQIKKIWKDILNHCTYVRYITQTGVCYFNSLCQKVVEQFGGSGLDVISSSLAPV